MSREPRKATARPVRARTAPVRPSSRAISVAEDQLVEVEEIPDPAALRIAIHEGAAAIVAARQAIAAAGHHVVVDATGRDGAAVIAQAIERERIDAVLVGLPHGQPVLDAVLARGAERPVVIASGTGAACDVVRRVRAAGADLAVTRPHDAERLALVLLAASRLVEQRRGAGAAHAVVEHVSAVHEEAPDEDSDNAVEVDLDDDPELVSSLDEGADDDLLAAFPDDVVLAFPDDSLDASSDDVVPVFPDDSLDASSDDVVPAFPDDVVPAFPNDSLDASANDVHNAPPHDAHDASSDDVHDASSDDAHDASSDDVHDASSDDVHDASSDDVHDASSDDVLAASSDDVHDASSDDVHDASSDDVLDASSDDVHDASSDDVLDASSDDVHDAPADDVLADPELRPGFESDPAWSAFDLDLDSDADGAGALRSFEQVERQLEVELELSQRHGHPISIAMLELVPPLDAPPGVSGILRARAGIAVAGAIREIDIAAPLPSDGSPERFLIVLPDTSRGDATDVARRVLEAVSSIDPVVAAGRALPAQVIGAVVTAEADPPRSVVRLLRDASRALDQARRDGAELAVPL